MRTRFRLLLGVAFVAAALVGCGRDTAPGDAPDQLTLYSIDGREVEPDEKPKAAETFHGQPVLGKVEVADAADRANILAALRDGMARTDGRMAKCFSPRHAVRVVDGGRTRDYVVCFECLQLDIHDGPSVTRTAVTAAAQPVFDKHLKAAGVPLAPGGRTGGGK